MKKGLKIGCLSIIGLLVLIILYFTFEPASWKNERGAKAKTHLREVTGQMVKLKAALPVLNEDLMGTRFEIDSLNWDEVITMSTDELKQFADTTLFVETPLAWGPWQNEQLKTFEDTYRTKPEYRNEFTQIDDGEVILKKKYAVVFLPVYYREPKQLNKKTFMPGYFDGWMILMDIKQLKSLGYSRLKAATKLKEIKGESLGIGVDPIPVGIPLINTTDFDEILQKDFRKEFFNEADSILRAYSGTKSDYKPPK